MSKKTTASSKSKKATTKKITKKVVAKKPVASKKSLKPNVKSKVIKKSTLKPPVKKAIDKKVTSKKSKNPVKKAVIKKSVKPVKTAIVNKVTPKKVAKKVVIKSKPVKAVAKKAKIVVKKATSKAKTPIVSVKKSLPLDIKTPVIKPEKPIKAKKEKAPPVKKTIIAPTTFRKEENITNTKSIKEPAGKFEMEFVIRASEDMVFEFISTESGLSEWFCDDVNIRNGIFTFAWEGQEQQAKLVKEIPPVFIRYQWLDKNDGSYFEFRIQKDELTNDISLIITDFASDKSDEESARLLWHSQIDKLLHVLGSFF